jgi:hypothetical protein
MPFLTLEGPLIMRGQWLAAIVARTFALQPAVAASIIFILDIYFSTLFKQELYHSLVPSLCSL